MAKPPDEMVMEQPQLLTQRTYKLLAARLLGDQLQPWRADPPDVRDINPIPGMICDDESRFLHWIARNHVSGEGCVVDLGPLAGGSTHALCSGLALNSLAAGRTRIHSYDLWRFEPGWERFFPGQKLKRGDNTHPLFLENLRAFGSTVVSHPGDLREQHWSGEPIEILFIDAAKSVEVWEHVLREFLPHCIPGRTLLLQQDWVCAECPWIHLTTARLSDYLVPVDSPLGGTVAFLLQRPIPRPLLEERDFLVEPISVALERLERAAAGTLGWYGLCVRLALAHYLVMRGRPEQAREIVDQTRRHPDYTATVRYDICLVLAAIKNEKRRHRAVLPAVKSFLRKLIKGRRPGNTG